MPDLRPFPVRQQIAENKCGRESLSELLLLHGLKYLGEDVWPLVLNNLCLFINVDKGGPQLSHGVPDLLVIIVSQHEYLRSDLHQLFLKPIIEHDDARQANRGFLDILVVREMPVHLHELIDHIFLANVSSNLTQVFVGPKLLPLFS